MKAGKQAEGTMLYSPFSDWMDDIDRQLAEETRNVGLTQTENDNKGEEKEDNADNVKSYTPQKRMDKFAESVEQAEDLESFATLRRQLVNQSVALVLGAKTVPGLIEF